MALTQVQFSEDEEKIILAVREKFKLNKPDAVKKMVSSYKNGETLL